MKKTMLKSLGLLALVAGITFTACKKDDDEDAFAVKTATAGTADLNAATAATGVDVSSTIIVTMNKDVDATTATSSIITLKTGSVSTAITVATVASVITITPTAEMASGAEYTLSLTGVKSTGGDALTKTLTFKTEGIGLGTAPQSANQIMYLQLNGNVTDLTGNATVASGAQVGYMADRFGNDNGAANFRGATTAGSGDIVELSSPKLMTPNQSISFWCKMNAADFPQGTSRSIFGYNIFYGYQLEVGNNLDYFKWTSRHKVNPDPNGIDNAGDDTDPNGDGAIAGEVTFDYLGSIPTLLNNKWVQIVLTFDAASAIKTIYVDGTKIMEKDLDFITGDPYEMHDLKLGDVIDATQTPRTGLGDKLALGWWVDKNFTTEPWALFSGAVNTYKGGLDDFRMWDKQLTASEVTSLYNAEKP